MWLGRIIFVIPVLALAGSLAKKKIVPANTSTSRPTLPFHRAADRHHPHRRALTFFPALSLDPSSSSSSCTRAFFTRRSVRS